MITALYLIAGTINLILAIIMILVFMLPFSRTEKLLLQDNRIYRRHADSNLLAIILMDHLIIHLG